MKSTQMAIALRKAGILSATFRKGTSKKEEQRTTVGPVGGTGGFSIGPRNKLVANYQHLETYTSVAAGRPPKKVGNAVIWTDNPEDGHQYQVATGQTVLVYRNGTILWYPYQGRRAIRLASIGANDYIIID